MSHFRCTFTEWTGHNKQTRRTEIIYADHAAEAYEIIETDYPELAEIIEVRQLH